jgi:hypothetical protein
VKIGWQLVDHFQVMFDYKVSVGGFFRFQDLYFTGSTLGRQLRFKVGRRSKVGRRTKLPDDHFGPTTTFVPGAYRVY